MGGCTKETRGRRWEPVIQTEVIRALACRWRKGVALRMSQAPSPKRQERCLERMLKLEPTPAIFSVQHTLHPFLYSHPSDLCKHHLLREAVPTYRTRVGGASVSPYHTSSVISFIAISRSMTLFICVFMEACEDSHLCRPVHSESLALSTVPGTEQGLWEITSPASAPCFFLYLWPLP